MNKLFYSLTILFLIFTISSCQKKSVEENKQISFENPLELSEIPSKIDLDLTGMNYNMINSITFEMLVEPEKYVDKTVKITGSYYANQHEGKWYYSVFIWDATGCCPVGLSFIPTNSVIEKLESLQQDDKITVTGTMKAIPAEDGTLELIYVAQSIECTA